MNFYKRHIGDYLKKTSHLSLLEHGIYNRLLDVYYTREDGIPEDQPARLIGARSPAEKQAVHSVLCEFFCLIDGVWRQDRCDEEIEAANEKAERNREVGKKGGRPRKLGSDTEPRNNPDGYFPEPTNNPSQTPDSSNQTPVTSKRGEESASTSPPDRPTNARSARATRLGDDFSLTDERRKVAQSEGLDADRTFANFRDYWLAKGGEKARKVCWDATWRVWCRSEQQQHGRTNGSRPRAGTYDDWASKHAEHEDQGFG